MNTPYTSTNPDSAVRRQQVDAAGTSFAVERRGDGDPPILIHGGGEDASMLAVQADSLAAAGFRVVTYDRRGTGGSGRDNWPGSGADQHADDAAALLRSLELDDATVVGVSSGGVVALDLAARHPDLVGRVVAWEPPAVGLMSGGEKINAAISAPIDEYLAAHPGDFVGAQAVLLTAILGVPVSVDDPALAASRANAEPMIRDDRTIPLATFGPESLAGRDVTVAVGSEPIEVIQGAAAMLAALTGRETVHGEGDHEVYLFDPSVPTGVVTSLGS